MSMPLPASVSARASGLHNVASSSASKMIWATMADADLDVGVQLLRRAVTGDAAAVEAAHGYLSRLFATKPFDPLLRAYAGSALALKATTCERPLDRLHHVSQGLSLIDQALEQLDTIPQGAVRRKVAVGLELRFVAACTFLSLPAMFNRATRGQALLEEVARSEFLPTAPAAFRSVVQHRLDQRGEAIAPRRATVTPPLSGVSRVRSVAASIRARLQSPR